VPKQRVLDLNIVTPSGPTEGLFVLDETSGRLELGKDSLTITYIFV
jgi:hypothetical protein